MALSLLTGLGLAYTAASALATTNRLTKEFEENKHIPLDEQAVRRRPQRFPFVHPSLHLQHPNTHQRTFNVIAESTTKTYVGENGVASITGLGTLDKKNTNPDDIY